MGDDGARLVHRRVCGHPRLFWFPAGLHRRGALLRRVRAWCIPRNSPRSSSASPRILLAVCARLRADRSAACGGDPCEWARGSGLQAAAGAVPPGPGPARRPARRGARCGPGSGHRLDPRSRGGADTRPGRATGGHPALGGPARAQPAAATDRIDPERARAARPTASGRGALARCRCASARRRAGAGCAQRLAQRRARARHRLRPGDRGFGLGDPAGNRRHQRACARRHLRKIH